MTEKEQLEQAVAALDKQRSTLGDAVVDAALKPIREKLAEMEEIASAGHQRRQVTVLFCDLVGFTSIAEKMDHEDVAGVLKAYYKPWREAISRWGGRLDKFIGDAVMAVFGMPIVEENDAENAIRAALEVRDGLKVFNDALEEKYGVRLSMRVGIHTGLVLAGDLGRPGDLTVTGDTVNLANRLESEAPHDSILISHDTYRHVRGVFDVVPREPISVKGKSKPVLTYVVERAKPRAFRMGTRGVEGIETRMVGREAEFVALQNAFADTMEACETRLVTVVGEAGVGKSRLLYEFENWLELRPEKIYFFKGRATPALRCVPYGIIRDMFAYRFDILESDSAAEALRKFRAGMGEFLPPDRADLIGHMVGFDFSTSQAVGKLVGSPDFGKLSQAYLTNYIRAMAEKQPMVMFLEDLHWADSSSLDLVEHLVTALPEAKLLVLCLARPALYENRPNWGEAELAFSRLDLKPLSKRASRALVAEILQQVAVVPDSLRDLIVDGAEGNPFFAEETVKMLLDEGAIKRTQGTREEWQLNDDLLRRVRIPSTLTALLQARLDSLPSREKHLLQCAAVVGRIFWDKAVAELAGLSQEESAHALESLRERELIFSRHRSAFAGTKEYIFRHALFHDVAYETVLLSQRRDIHAQVANWLESHAGERIGEYAAVIAGHLERAGLAEEAADHFIKAGKKGLDSGALKESLEFSRRALSLLPEESGKRTALMLLAGEALLWLGSTDEATEQLKAGLAIAEKAKDEKSCAEALCHLGWIAYDRGDWELSRKQLERSLSLARKIDDRARAAHVLSNLSWLNMRQGEYLTAREILTECQSLYKALGDRLGMARALNGLGAVANNLEEYKEAESLYLESLSLSREAGTRLGEAVILGNLGENSRKQKDYLMARKYYLESLEIGREISSKPLIARTMGSLGHTASALGEYVSALESYREALRCAKETGNIPFMVEDIVGIAGVMAYTGDRSLALELLGLAIHHSALPDEMRPYAAQVLDDLHRRLTPEEIEAGLERGQGLKLESVVEELLRMK